MSANDTGTYAHAERLIRAGRGYERDRGRWRRPDLGRDTRVVVFDEDGWLSEQEITWLGRNLSLAHIERLGDHLAHCDVRGCRDALHVEALMMLTHATRLMRSGGLEEA